MRRLRKQAWDNVELYHHTSSQVFAKVMEEGYLTSSEYNGTVSGGAETYNIAYPGDEIFNEEITLGELNEIIENNDGKITIIEDLINLVNQLKKENPNWEDEKIIVRHTIPEMEEIGVYLTNDEYDALGDYGRRAVEKNGNSSRLNFITAIKVKVQTDALSPDYGDLAGTELDKSEGSDPLWKQSLELIEQCVHNGPIDTNDIVSVQFISFFTSFKYLTDSKFNSEEEFIEFVEQFIQEGNPMPAKEALNQLKLIEEEYATIKNQITSSKKTKRLKNNR